MGTVPIEHDLKSLLDLHKQDVFASLNCHAVGTIQSFDPSSQTAEVTINYKVPYSDGLLKYPAIVDCPVVVLGGSKGSLRFPIKRGDQCLIMFNDRDIDNWFSGKNNDKPNSNRLHSFSDAIALVGLRSLQSKLTDYDPERTELVHDQTKVSLKEKIKIVNSVTDLKVILDAIVDAINTHTHPVSTTGSSTAQTGTASATLSPMTNTNGDLLE